MRVGIATDHGGFGLKEELLNTLKAAGDKVVDFGAHALSLIHDHFSAKQGVQDDHLNILCMGARAVGLWWSGIGWTAF